MPAVEKVVETASTLPGASGVSREVLVVAVRDVISSLRGSIIAGEGIDDRTLSRDAVAVEALRNAAALVAGSLARVVNLTGVVLHTNLGRAPIGRGVAEEVFELATSYTNLEFDLAGHRRGSRYDHVASMLLALAPAEAALVVNNNAAAVLLVLGELASGREVVVSRGELIEIGGGFRIPDVMAASGARLVEVGTTNRTRVADYSTAIGPETALLFKAHRSNFSVKGFVAEVGYRELAALAHDRGLPLVADLGSGLLARLPWRTGEPGPREVIEAGADLVCFSGDKLMGGPQAGIILGRADLVARLRRNPLLRALRVCKLTIAALEATLRRYLTGAERDLPVIDALAASGEEVRRRCGRLVRMARTRGLPPDISLAIVPVSSEVGGGSLPGAELPSYAVEIRSSSRSEVAIERALRSWRPPILGRIEGGRLLLDCRTMLRGEERLVAEAISELQWR